MGLERPQCKFNESEPWALNVRKSGQLAKASNDLTPNDVEKLGGNIAKLFNLDLSHGVKQL